MKAQRFRVPIGLFCGMAILLFGPSVSPACDPNGVYASSPPLSYSCAMSLVDLQVTEFLFGADGGRISPRSTQPAAPLLGPATGCPSGLIDNTSTVPGACEITYVLVGQFTGDDTWVGTFSVGFVGSGCADCVNQQLSVAGSRLSLFVDDFEFGDTGRWSAVEDGRWHPLPFTSWQWQLTGTIDTTIDVEMYDIDLFDVPAATIADLKAAGRAVICYLSAGTWEDWRPDAASYPPEVLGNDVGGWPGERWVDIRRLDLLGPILKARLDLAVSKGCTGVEPDNVDAYQNGSGFPLTAADQLTFNRWLATESRSRGLSVGLKNDLDQVAELVGDFDWALNEQCYEYAECHMLQPFIDAGKAVFGVEYNGDQIVFCPYFNALNYSWMKKEFDLGVWRIDCRDLR